VDVNPIIKGDDTAQKEAKAEIVADAITKIKGGATTL
jgi:hypothetical protein